MTEAYPLHWPEGYKRTQWPRKSAFKVSSFAQVRDGIIREIKLLGGKNAIISTNIPLRADGLPYATFKRPQDHGVAIYFTYKNEQMVFACDQWNRIEDNMRAVEKAIEAMRGLDRWGVSDMLKRAFTGFKALPEQAAEVGQTCWDILGIKVGSGVETIKSAYRDKAKLHHPDAGGSSEMFAKLQNAYQQALQISNP